MALGDYILCDRCNCKLIYDGDMGNREWWVERFGKEPEILCPPCQQEMAMARVQLLGRAVDDAKDAKRYRWLRDHAKRDWLDAGITDDAVDEAINDRSSHENQKTR